MLEPLLTLLAAKAKVAALVAGTALATTAVVGGGGTLVLQSVSDSSPAPEIASSAEPSPTAEPSVSPSAEPSPSGEPSVSPSVEPSEPAAEPTAEPAAEPSAEPAPAAAAVPFVCDESKNHGQNVSAYARSLPKGPGRGQLVSEAARSDCGKKAAADAPEDADQGAAEEETAEPATPAKPAKPAKPGKPTKPGRS